MATIGEMLKVKLGLFPTPEEELCERLRIKIGGYGLVHVEEDGVGLVPEIHNKVKLQYRAYGVDDDSVWITIEAQSMVAALKDCLRIAEALDKFDGGTTP